MHLFIYLCIFICSVLNKCHPQFRPTFKWASYQRVPKICNSCSGLSSKNMVHYHWCNETNWYNLFICVLTVYLFELWNTFGSIIFILFESDQNKYHQLHSSMDILHQIMACVMGASSTFFSNLHLYDCWRNLIKQNSKMTDEKWSNVFHAMLGSVHYLWGGGGWQMGGVGKRGLTPLYRGGQKGFTLRKRGGAKKAWWFISFMQHSIN